MSETSRTTGSQTPASLDDSVVVAGSASAIIDASGNAWTITSDGQVAINGIADTTTAAVTDIAYVSGAIWQEYIDNLWWRETTPAGPWGPAGGTATSPLPASAAPGGSTSAAAAGQPSQTATASPAVAMPAPAAAAPAQPATTAAVVAQTSASGAAAATTSAATGTFHVANGQIMGPGGTPFVAKGINIFDSQMSTVSSSSAGGPLLKMFPGTNMVRLAVQDYASAANLSAFVSQMTALHIVVEIEDHSVGGGTANVLTGSALATEVAWYQQIATTFKGNPYVWFGSMNEPDNISNEAAVTNQEAAIYNAIRGAGNTNPIMMEQIGGFSSTENGGLTASAYSKMTNIIWDSHYYGWCSNYSTNQSAVAAALTAQVANAQTIKSADGVVPVIVGEYGISTTGSGAADANGTQVVTAVDSSGYGSLAWAWSAGTDALVGGGTTLSAFGQQVARYLATPTPTPPRPCRPRRMTRRFPPVQPLLSSTRAAMYGA